MGQAEYEQELEQPELGGVMGSCLARRLVAKSSEFVQSVATVCGRHAAVRRAVPGILRQQRVEMRPSS